MKRDLDIELLMNDGKERKKRDPNEMKWYKESGPKNKHNIQQEQSFMLEGGRKSYPTSWIGCV